MSLASDWQSVVCVGFESAAAAWVLIFLFRLAFVAPYSLWKEQKEKIKKLERIDDSDLEHLLYGFFCGDTFTYKCERQCNPGEYKTKYEIEKLRNNWTEISVPAPKNSLAKIKFEISNGHPRGRRDFYILGSDGRDIHIDIYAQNYVLLDSKSCFCFKLTYSDDYEIYDAASIRIEVESWKK